MGDYAFEGKAKEYTDQARVWSQQENSKYKRYIGQTIAQGQRDRVKIMNGVEDQFNFFHMMIWEPKGK